MAYLYLTKDKADKIIAERDEARYWARRFYKESNTLETNLRVFERAFQGCKEELFKYKAREALQKDALRNSVRLCSGCLTRVHDVEAAIRAAEGNDV